MWILEKYHHSLIFRLDTDAPKKYINRWKKIKFDCEQGYNKYIIEKMKSYCELESNQHLPYLQREEGGVGGNNNHMNKQIRFFRLYSCSEPLNYNDKDIVLNQIINTNTEKWSYDELDDLIYAFTKTFNYFIKSDCINGFIEMQNKKCLYDDDDFT